MNVSKTGDVRTGTKKALGPIRRNRSQATPWRTPVHRFHAILIFTAAAALAACNSSNAVPQSPLTPAKPIQHVVIMMQENRSFNNIFAGFPGAETAMSGPCEKARWCKTGTATLTPVTLETTDRLGLGTDIDHSHNGFKIECDLNASGICQNDGFDKIRFGESGTGEVAKLYAYAYVERSETKAYWDFAKQYALADQNVLHADGSQLYRAPDHSLRHRGPQLPRIAHRSARRHAVGLRCIAGHASRHLAK